MSIPCGGAADPARGCTGWPCYTHAMGLLGKHVAKVNWREVATLTAIFVVVFVLWNTRLMFPLRTLVVFFHEFSHAAAALLTGGRIVEIQVTPGSGGLCITAGGWPIVIYSAGYLGSMLTGGVLLVLSNGTRAAVTVTGVLGIVLVSVTLGWVRPMLGFGFLFGIAAGAVLIASAVWLPAWANASILKIIGLTSCLFAFVDLKSLFSPQPGLESDATLLARITWVPAWAWASFWLLISAVVAYHLLKLACRRPPSPNF